MFASQLLRILQTIPGDVKNETCFSSEKDAAMNENMNSSLDDSNFEGKVLMGVERGANPSSSEDGNGSRNLSENEIQNGAFYPQRRPNEDPESSSSDSNENLTTAAGDSSIFNGNEVRDLAQPFTDKNVLECENQMDFHAVKDICMDEGPFIPLESAEAANNDTVSELPNLPLGGGCCSIGVDVAELGGAKSSSENNCDNDLMPRVESSCSETEETAADCPAADRCCIVERALPIQEFGTRSFLRSFITSLDGKDNKIGRFQPHQVALKEDVPTSALFYNSKVESKTITFDFDPPLIETANVSIGKPENPITQLNVDGHQNSDLNDEESLKVENGYADDFSFENAFQGVGSHVMNVSCNDEPGFPDAGFGPWPGPIPVSGSISFRSDGSTTSRRSFAFPILQSEWNSSPIRMTKADGRHLRKHKFWRSSLLCCRF